MRFHVPFSLGSWVRDNEQRRSESHVVLAIIPKIFGRHFYWLGPISRRRESVEWKPAWFLDSGYASWWSYSEPPKGAWGIWFRTRPFQWVVRLAEVVGFFWLPVLLAGGTLFTLYKLIH
ncbi:MAG: hypothetical protein L0Y56_06165 [Nitrospira sp.]|nr:hypothetical protein [Nitrospira sp.]